MRLALFTLIATLIPPAQSPPCERDAHFWHICGPIDGGVAPAQRQLESWHHPDEPAP